MWLYVRLFCLIHMTQLAIALTGFFVWSGAASIASSTPVIAPVAEPPPVIVDIVEHSASTPRRVRLTAYNALPEQTDDTPELTGSGIPTNPETIAARSQDLKAELPFGTVIALESPSKSNACGFSTVKHLIGYRVIADSMHERKRNQIDILLNENDLVPIGVSGKPKTMTNPAIALGLCTVEMRVVGRIPLSQIPTTQAELALMVRTTLASK